MGTYAAGAKLSELTLAGEPPPAVDPPAAASLRPSVGNAVQDAQRTTHSSTVEAAPLRLADAPAEAIEISTVEAVTRSAVSDAVRDSNSRKTDEFSAAATREFEAGQLDQPLWAKAIGLAGNDAALAKPAYLRARATALRIAKQKKRAELQAQRAQELSREEKDGPVAPTRSNSPSRPTMLIAGVLGFVVVIAGYLVLRPAGDPPKPSDISNAAAAGTKTGQPAPPQSAKPVPRTASGPERLGVSSDDLAKKVQELKDAGNWNVLVLYAVEWTRKVPGNPDAWNELSMGYVKLRQFNEALDAATKAVQLAPENFQAWQNLGEVNVALRLPAAALAAYERAAELNARDVTSLVQSGMLNAQLGHLPQAMVAFTKALDVNPLDADALCGAASIAQKEGRPKEAEPFMRQLKAADLRCRDANPVEAVSVAAVPVAKKKPGASMTR